ncbi:MAG: hypothetical protein QXN55_01480 [Candidatus Nitrosotenuis sp.]
MSRSNNTNQGRISRNRNKVWRTLLNGRYNGTLSLDEQANLQSEFDTEGYVPTGTLRFGNNRNYERDLKTEVRRKQRRQKQNELRDELNF